MKIRVVEFEGVRPAVAYTDFSAVYVSTSLSGEQRRTALRHERAHIWLQHQTRSSSLERELGEKLDRKAWNIAADLEIARHIYTQRDDDAITDARSPLGGGIRRKHCDEFLTAIYAEDYYVAIMASAPPEGVCSIDGDASDEASNKIFNVDGDASDEATPSYLVEAARKCMEVADAEDQQRTAATQAQYKIDGFKPPKPSLASALDSYIGRSVRARVENYRRPSRRTSDSDLIAKGVTTKRVAPRVTIYVDRSGSFSPTKTSASIQTLSNCLMKYRCRIDCDVIYFNDQLMHIDPLRGFGGTNYQPVIDQIFADRAEIALIITDADSAEGVIVPNDMPPVLVLPVDCDVTHIGRALGVEQIR